MISPAGMCGMPFHSGRAHEDSEQLYQLRRPDTRFAVRKLGTVFLEIDSFELLKRFVGNHGVRLTAAHRTKTSHASRGMLRNALYAKPTS